MLEGFTHFIQALRIESKDTGLVPLRLNGAQRFLLGEIRRGLGENVRTFIILKGRQFGVSTLTLALDLYWCFRYPGLQATLIPDDDANKEYFRSILGNFLEGMPRSHRIPIQSFNRIQLSLKNRSRLVFQVAGVRTANRTLGRAKGINYCHATEAAFWADQDGLASLTASFSERYPARLYLFESTANGFNQFETLYRESEQAVTRRAIFIGWWRHENYALPANSPLFRVYQGPPNSEESEWMERVKLQYQYSITPSQLAWWRWKLEEEIGDYGMMLQEYPPVPDLAFRVTGSQFFASESLSQAIQTARTGNPPQEYDYHFGEEFQTTRLENAREGELKIWEMPVADANYVIGADPAYGASAVSDGSSLVVFRSYSDGLEQVAELSSNRYTTYQFAWAIVHLAGAYGGRLNVELNGPGRSVWEEIQRLQRLAAYLPYTEGQPSLLNFVSGIRHYFYRRPDSITSGWGAYHTKTNFEIKNSYMNGLRNTFERKQLEIRSLDLLDEMRTLRHTDGHIEAFGRNHDDRVIAAALAVQCWADYEQAGLAARGRSRAAAKTPAAGENPGNSVLEYGIQRFFQQVRRGENPHA